MNSASEELRKKYPHWLTKPLKAIRLKCLDCCGGSQQEVDKCPIKDCFLYSFRKGKNPYYKKKKIEENEE